MQIRFDEKSGKYCVFDMKSRNGVYVNERRIDEETFLADGDVIMIGLTTLLFVDQDFKDKDSALLHYKKVGERMRVTSYGPREAGEFPGAQPPTAKGETGHPIVR